MSIIRDLIKKYKKHTNPIQFYRDLGAKIGERCEFRGSVNLGSEPYLITIGDHVRLNQGVSIVTHDGGAWVLRDCSSIENKENLTLFGRVEIGNNVHIGTNAMVMPNVKIGSNVIIGSGAIVTKDIPDNSVAVGVPARVIETVSEYEAKHISEFSFTKNMNKDQVREYLSERYNLK